MIKQVIISLWFKELEYNPICKVGELERNLNNYFISPFLINDKEPFINIGLPRILARSIDNKSIFNMSLVNANLNINYNSDLLIDDILLEINEKYQVIYDVLKDVYDLEILYSSIKIEYVKYIDNVLKIQKELINEECSSMEDFSLKKTYKKEQKFYINYITTITKEVKVDIKMPKDVQPIEQDMITRSMLISLQDSNIVGDISNTLLEVNDRLAYNNDSSYRVSKDDIRDLFFEFKLLVDKELKKKK